MDEILNSIIPSLQSGKDSIAKILTSQIEQDHPELIEQLLKDSNSKLEDVSLLNLKNDAMLSYINNIVMIILSQIERIEKGNVEEKREKAVESTIVQRVTLERGIKPLEKKLNYQLDKMIRSYNKMVDDYESNDHTDATKRKKSDTGDDDSSEEESEDELSYRPDASSLMKPPTKRAPKTDTTTETEAYKPPKISAMAPPRPTEERAKPSKKLQSMEEYLREASDLPQEEKSIGVNIVNHGRGGIKTDIERKKEKEVQSYEEDNFLRLPTTITKKDKRQKRKDLVNTFGGEDWSMFGNSRDVSQSTSRKRKNTSVWDKVKRRS